MLTVAVLGGVELRRGGVLQAVPAGKVTELLVRLAIDAGQPVRAERLIEDLWAGHAAGTAKNTLQSKVSGLRRALGDPALLVSGSNGYTLVVERRDVDALEVLRLADSVAAQKEAGDVQGVISTCATALAMFRGEVLAGAGDGEWAAPYRARLEEARLRLIEESFTARLERGAAGELTGDLEDVVSAHPLREGLWALLITALYRDGRQAEALAALRRVREHLAEELGLDPGPQLHALEQQVLRQELAPARHRSAMLGNLPPLASALIGRERELADLRHLRRDHRLVTITGPAGVGKTRLALELARDDSVAGGAPGDRAIGGAWLARLETAMSVPAVWQVVGDALNLSDSTEDAVLQRLSGPPLTLVLDNCEHIAGLLPPIISRLLADAPELRILATSQVPLGIDGEALYPLEPLELGAAVQLFSERAAQQRVSRPVPGDLLESVCRSLDRLPLAIELAAARTKVLSVQEIARRLGDRFALLNDPASRRPARQRTLAAAIGWSYDLLFPDDQRGLQALACFSGGAPLAAAEHVLGALGVPLAAALDVFDRLADRSLVSTDADDAGWVRYRLLDSVREFSLAALAAAGDVDVAQHAHAAWFATAAARAQAGARGPEQAEHLALARAERANIDAALAWAADHDPILGAQIAAGFGWTWAVLGTGPDGARRIRQALTSLPAIPALAPLEALASLEAQPMSAASDVQSIGLFLASWLEAAGGDLRRASADLDQAMARADDEGRLTGQVYLAFLRTQEGRPADVLAILDACRDELGRRALIWELGAAWLLTAWAQIALGQVLAAQAACDESLRLFTELGDDWARIHTGAMLGGLAQAQGRYADAAHYLGDAAAAAGRLGFDAARALHLGNLGRVQQQNGDLVLAAATLGQAAEAALATGDLRMTALARVRLSRVQRALGDRVAARATAGQARAWYVRAGGGEGALLARYVLAALAAEDSAADDVEGTTEELNQVVDDARAAGDRESELLALDALARAHAAADRPDQVRALLQLSDGLLPSVRHLVTDSDRLDRISADELLRGVTHLRAE